MALRNFPHNSIFFCLMIHHIFPLQFNFPNIGPEQTRFINVTKDAYISQQGIQLTSNERSVSLYYQAGRATFVQPLHLWDNASGYLAEFQTHFSFVIDADDNSSYADGLAFFLAPVGSNIPENSAGSGLGLADKHKMEGNSVNPFVAVEFDTYTNNGSDPDVGKHVGIDINSLKSAASATWNDNTTQGNVNNAWITYDSITKNLTVTFTGFWENKIETQSLSYILDLRDVLPEWVIFGFSASTGVLFEKNNVKSWKFNSSTQQILAPAPHVQSNPVPAIPSNPSLNAVPKRQKELEIGLVIALVVSISLVLVLAAFIGYFLWKKRNKNEVGREGLRLDRSLDREFEKGLGPKKFTYRELAEATNNFAEQEKLGEGGFGSVYRGWVKDLNSYIAVKRVSSGSNQGPKEYASEVKIISQVRHRNLVQLIGWCHEKSELLLVYEFMPNGSLHSHLFRERSLLTWDVRYKIVRGLASALLYLHEEWEQCVVHRDIKSSNIMLDLSFNAKLGDFGLARIVDHEKGSQTTALAGTMGYVDPECAITGKASKESDVYSFGVVVLEIASGRKPIDVNARENEIMLVEWIWDLYGKGKLLEGADPKLCKNFDYEELERLMIVGLWCAHPKKSTRPTIRQAIQVLNFEGQIPVLPSKMPLETEGATCSDPKLHNVHLSEFSSAARI